MDAAVDLDFVVIGAGMAGASVAAHLACRGRVAMFEAEEHAGYHSTGRSAALFSQIYGNHVVRALARASREFLFDAPPGFAPTPLVNPRATMYFARTDQLERLERFREDPDVRARTRLLGAGQAHALVPVFRAGYLAGAALEEGSADIDVHALHQGFLRQARAGGARLHLRCRIDALVPSPTGRWTITTAAGAFRAPVVVNAAGAWGDEVARRAGVAPIGLTPLRRTAVLVHAPDGVACAGWPAAIDVDEQFYFKPDAGLLLLSPADETPSAPCDAQPEELDVAIAVDRFEQATGTRVRQVAHRWAGLRVFSPDRSPVAGFDPRAPGFFWLVGQGGYGIQTAAALGRVAAALAAGEALPADIAAEGVDMAMLSRARFDRAD